MYVDPEGGIDCGACIPACTTDSIHAFEDVPEDKKEFVEKNRGLLQALILKRCACSSPPTLGVDFKVNSNAR
jgi:Fe-S-cluster-containing hydrogenase component 2